MSQMQIRRRVFWMHKFRTTDISDNAERQRLIDSFVNAIYLYDDKIVMAWNYKDGTKTVTLKDIEGSDLSLSTVPKSHIFPISRRYSFFYAEKHGIMDLTLLYKKDKQEFVEGNSLSEVT